MKREILDVSENAKNVYEKSLIEYVKKTVSNYYGLDESCLELNTRKKEVTKIRQVSMYLITKNCRITTTRLGGFFNKDHATVIYSLRAIKNHLDYDKFLQREIKDLQSIISLKTKAILNDYDLSKEFYFIDLNKFVSYKLDNNKAIILVDFEDYELEEFKKKNKLKEDFKLHERTGMYILDKLMKIKAKKEEEDNIEQEQQQNNEDYEQDKN